MATQSSEILRRYHMQILEQCLSKRYNPELVMCRRSAGRSQEHIRPDFVLDVVYDVTGVTGCIIGVPDLQPGCAATRSAIQGPSGTFG